MEIRRQGDVREGRREDGRAEGIIFATLVIRLGGSSSRRISFCLPMRRAPAAAGIGLRAPHVREVLAQHPAVPWFEVHSENYYVDGGPALSALERIRADYPLSLHGVGMSLGSTDPLDRAHLAKLARLIERTEPALVSEHLCWSGVAGRALNDLLPLPYTEESLAHVCARVAEVQDFLGRTI